MCAGTEGSVIVSLDDLVDQLKRDGLRVVGSEWHPPALSVLYVVEVGEVVYVVEDGKDDPTQSSD